MKHAKCYVSGYPRPQFVRDGWAGLNGKWDFAFDRDNAGERGGWGKGFKKQYDITVPFAYESEASGIGITEAVENVWYARKFTISAAQLKKRAVLHFEGVDYTAKVWVNGIPVGSHSGGYSRFSFDITNYIKAGENLLVVKAEDSFDLTQPRGKQRWKEYNYLCWYVQTTGIWKTVWLEFTDARAWIDSVKITPRIDLYAFDFEFDLAFKGAGYALEIAVGCKDEIIKRVTAALDTEVYKTTVPLASPVPDWQVCCWAPHHPFLYDLEFTLLKDGAAVDSVKSYCGLRELKAVGSTFQITHFQYFQKLALYQGYWEKTLLTAPDEEAIVKDIEMLKEMGFNGARVHQIVDERFLYYADILGLLVWCEMPSAQAFGERMKGRFTKEWLEIVKQHYNHSCVAAWVPFNESWGVREIAYNKEQQAFNEAVYKLTKAYDLTRPVISNDGWEHTVSDMLTLHTYQQDAAVLTEYYSDLNRFLNDAEPRMMQPAPYAEGYKYGGQPVIISEYGGISLAENMRDGDFGYGQSAKTLEEFYERFGALTDAIKALPYCAGYCYTQFSDVQQERNGLVTMGREYKADPARIREINGRHIKKR